MPPITLSRSFRRRVAIAALTLPLLQASTLQCADIATQALIFGFFDGITPALLEAAQQGFQDSFSGTSADNLP